MPRAVWQTEGKLARLNLPPLSGWLDLDRVDAGIARLSIAGRPLERVPGDQRRGAASGPPAPRPGESAILGLELPGTAGSSLSPRECYPRQHDLLAWFSAREDWPVEVQAIWRGVQGGEKDVFATAVDLIIGVRSQTLESDPGLSVVSTLPASQAMVVGLAKGGAPLGPWDWASAGATAGAYLFRLPGEWSYVEMVHPATRLASQSWPVDANRARLRHRLFSEPAEKLEKGVLLRAWIRGALVPQDEDMRRAARIYEAFAASEPPLST